MHLFLLAPSFFSFFCPSHDLKIPCDICPLLDQAGYFPFVTYFSWNYAKHLFFKSFNTNRNLCPQPSPTIKFTKWIYHPISHKIYIFFVSDGCRHTYMIQFVFFFIIFNYVLGIWNIVEVIIPFWKQNKRDSSNPESLYVYFQHFQ